MKIIYEESEIIALLKKVIPGEFVPNGWSLVGIALDGHSYDRRFVITIDKEREPIEAACMEN